MLCRSPAFRLGTAVYSNARPPRSVWRGSTGRGVRWSLAASVWAFQVGRVGTRARVPYVVVSVGLGVDSTLSRLLLSAALRMARYRSYRDANSKKAVAARLLGPAVSDPVVPDLAFSLPSSALPPPSSIRTIAGSRTVVALSPIAIGKPDCWPTADLPLYDRYLNEMARVLSQLLRRDYFLASVISCLDEDQLVIPELLGRLDEEIEGEACRSSTHPGDRDLAGVRSYAPGR